MSVRKYVIELVDQETNCVDQDLVFETDDAEFIISLTGLSQADFNRSFGCDLTAEELDKLARRFELSVPGTVSLARLRVWATQDALPYRTHTGRELALMLRKLKPLAFFYEMVGDDPELELIPDRYFKKYVDLGSIIRREVIVEDSEKQLDRFVFYALPGEEWRIDAFILLKKTAEISGWSEGLSRMEGSLLGYEDWQNDAHIKLTFKSRGG